MNGTWPAIQYEELPWRMDPDERLLIPKSRRRKIGLTYRAAIPPKIAERIPEIPDPLRMRSQEIANAIARFDGTQKGLGFRLPALILRSESSASSQIENLTSSVRNVALAELSPDAPKNALLIAGNIAAMRTALAQSGEFSLEHILAIHRALLEHTGESFSGNLRDEQVWIGGTPYSPHGARFVPPAPEHIEPLLQDLVMFCKRSDVDPIAQAAIAHAQFETIHPFIGGNGRTGRALIHRQLALSGLLVYATLPLSAGLLHDIDAYLAALDEYHDGHIEPIVEVLCDALEIALCLGSRTSARIQSVLDDWMDLICERKGSKIWQLPALLVEQPVVNAAYVSEHLGITKRAAQDLLARACEYGTLEQSRNRKRGRFYQASQLIDILEELTSRAEIRRVLVSGNK